jgi:acetyl-CoA C-acetyltransferase
VADPLLLRADFLDKAIAAYTSEEAVQRGVGREEQDAWALRSHVSYFEAEAAGYFEPERFAWNECGASLDADESPRADTSGEKLAQLKPVYGSPTVTPGNAPGLNDGAAFLVLASRSFAKAHGVARLATLVDYDQVASGPTTGSYTPALAIRKILSRRSIPVESLARLEINEAFAATPLVSTLELANGDRSRTEALRERTNLAGGAVAIGHPLGASGASITMTLINGLLRGSGHLGVAAICGGYGQGDAVLVEVGD